MSENKKKFTRVEKFLSEKSQYVLSSIVFLTGIQLFIWGRKLRKLNVENQKLVRDNNYLKKAVKGTVLLSVSQFAFQIIQKVRN